MHVTVSEIITNFHLNLHRVALFQYKNKVLSKKTVSWEKSSAHWGWFDTRQIWGTQYDSVFAPNNNGKSLCGHFLEMLEKLVKHVPWTTRSPPPNITLINGGPAVWKMATTGAAVNVWAISTASSHTTRHHGPSFNDTGLRPRPG